MPGAVLLAYAFDPPLPGREIIAMLRRAEAAVFPEGDAPPMKASCGERHGMAYWGPEEGWAVGDGQSVAALDGLRATRPVSGEAVSIVGGERALHRVDFAGGHALANNAAALDAFAGTGMEAG